MPCSITLQTPLYIGNRSGACYEWLGIVSEAVWQFQAVEMPTESNNSVSGLRAGAQ
jgi:hypothetical protein